MKSSKNIQRILFATIMLLAITEISYGQGFTGLQHFRSEVQAETIAFDWSLEESRNVKAFGLERAGSDLQFETIGTVVVRPTHHASSTYRFVDQHPLAGAAFYRLKVMDHAGNVHYCKVISQVATASTQTGR